MKKLMIIIGVATIVSCNKKVECCTSSSAVYDEYSEYDFELYNCIEVEGTKEEIKEYEKMGTKVTDGYGYVLTSKTECR